MRLSQPYRLASLPLPNSAHGRDLESTHCLAAVWPRWCQELTCENVVSHICLSPRHTGHWIMRGSLLGLNIVSLHPAQSGIVLLASWRTIRLRFVHLGAPIWFRSVFGDIAFHWVPRRLTSARRHHRPRSRHCSHAQAMIPKRVLHIQFPFSRLLHPHVLADAYGLMRHGSRFVSILDDLYRPIGLSAHASVCSRRLHRYTAQGTCRFRFAKSIMLA